MFERFTDRARRVVVLAQEEARLLGHDYIGTEHLLLGLIQEGDGVAYRALKSLDVSFTAVRQEIEELVGSGTSAGPWGHIPFTPRAKKVLELALRESRKLGHDYIGSEHILLGLIREGDGVGAQVLEKLGVGLGVARTRVVELLSRMGIETVGEQVERSFDPIEARSGVGPCCPRCGRELEGALAVRRMSAENDEGEREVVVVFCTRCGNALGAF